MESEMRNDVASRKSEKLPGFPVATRNSEYAK